VGLIKSSFPKTLNVKRHGDNKIDITRIPVLKKGLLSKDAQGLREGGLLAIVQ
jgi:hypothetical protein